MSGSDYNSNTIFHPLAMNSFRHWRELYRTSGGIEPEYVPRAWLINFASPLWAPFRWLERALHAKEIAATTIDKPPIFVLGHWRTGTTHLHNLFAQDENLGYVTTFQTLAPDTFFLGQHTIRYAIKLAMPETRPFDNMKMSTDYPQEEEFALCNVTPHSFYVGFYFPKRFPELFEKYVLFRNVSEEAIREWEEAYLTLLKKATMNNEGRRLVLKNPSNTGRIPQLLKLFPDAKFVHIHRDPFRVYKSTVHLYNKVQESIGFQRVSQEEIERRVLDSYRQMMEKYCEDRERIPSENLMEVGYDELIEDGLGTMERVYDRLNLPDWEAARARMATYLDSLQGYRKNSFTMDLDTIQRIEADWGFAIDKWQYSRPHVTSGSPITLS